MNSLCGLATPFKDCPGSPFSREWPAPLTRTPGYHPRHGQDKRFLRHSLNDSSETHKKSRKRERVAGKRGRSSIKSPTSQTSAIVARSIGLTVVTIRSITGFRLTALTVLTKLSSRQVFPKSKTITTEDLRDPSMVDGAPCFDVALFAAHPSTGSGRTARTGINTSKRVSRTACIKQREPLGL